MTRTSSVCIRYVRSRREGSIPTEISTWPARSYLQTLSLSFYPEELGPYNPGNASSLSAAGRIQNPRASWGGIMRKIDASDFESANVEYLEFWLMDPWADQPQGRVQGGETSTSTEVISRRIFSVMRKTFESGLPVVAGSLRCRDCLGVRCQPSSVWAMPSIIVRELERSRMSDSMDYLPRRKKTYPAYMTPLPATGCTLQLRASWQADPLSPLNDPGRDDFRHYRSSLCDSQRSPILERYKYYNGTEGNSSTATGEDGYALASTLSPDAEDVNGDYHPQRSIATSSTVSPCVHKT